MEKLKLKNDKRGWDVTAKKVVRYSYVEKDGCVCRANGMCVGNIHAGDFSLTIPKNT